MKLLIIIRDWLNSIIDEPCNEPDFEITFRNEEAKEFLENLKEIEGIRKTAFVYKKKLEMIPYKLRKIREKEILKYDS